MESTDHKIVISRKPNKIIGFIVFGILILYFLYKGYTNPDLFNAPGSNAYLAYLIFWGMPLITLFLLLSLLFRMPNAIILNGPDRTIEKIYPLHFFAPEGRISSFSDWSAVQSYLSPATSENGPYVVLALCAADGEHMILDSKPAPYKNKPGFWNIFPTYFEPDEIRDLRIRVVSLTGLNDLGFTEK